VFRSDYAYLVARPIKDSPTIELGRGAFPFFGAIAELQRGHPEAGFKVLMGKKGQ